MTAPDPDRNSQAAPEISVIIPSYNSREKISACIAALRAQEVDVPFEIVVADSSDDGTGEHLATLDGIVLVRSDERVYPGTARNRGAAAARGRLLCFIDADCLASADWLQRAWEAYLEEPRTVIGGAILNGTPDNAVGTAEYFSELSGMLPGKPKHDVEFLPGANFSVSAECFSEAGGFRDYEKGSDVTFGSACRGCGVQPVFHPEVRVSHRNRTDARGFLANQEKLGWGTGNNRVLHDLPGSWLAHHPVAWPLVPLARFARITWRSFRDGGSQRSGLVAAIPWIFLGSLRFGAGFVRGVRDGREARGAETPEGLGAAMRKPRVLINIAGEPDLNAERGGAIERIVANQANALAESCDVTVFGDLGPLGPEVRTVAFRGTMRLSYTALPSSLISLARAIPSMLRVPSDVVIATHSMNLVLSFVYSRLRRVPLVAWETDHDPWVGKPNILKTLHARTVARAEVVITESDEQARRMEAAGVRRDRIRVVPLPVDTAIYHPAACAAVADERGEFLLYVAKFVPRKNQRLLIEAFSLLARAREGLRLVLVGPRGGGYTATMGGGPTSPYFDECMDIVTSAGLSDRVETLERLSERDLAELYRGCALFVFPSLEEGFGLTLLEAMACGCAVLSNDIEPMRQVVGDAGLLLPMNGPQELARAIDDLLSDGGRLAELRARAARRASEAFDPGVIHARFAAEVGGVLRPRP